MNILNSNLPDHEKLARYHEVLQTSLNLQEFNPPILKEKVTELNENLSKKDNEEVQMDEGIKIDKKDVQEMKVENEDEDCRDLILAAIPKSKRSIAENILVLIKKQPNVLSYNNRGEIILHGQQIENSYITDLIKYTLNSRSNVSDNNVYNKAINDLNIPKSFIINKRLLHSTVEDVSKKPKLLMSKYNLRKGKHVSLPFKWENLK
jgi:hypothetical protein